MAGSRAVDLNIASLFGEAIAILRMDPGKFAALSAIGLAPSWFASVVSGSFLVSLIVLIVSLPIAALANGALVVLASSLRNRGQGGGGRSPRLGELLAGPRDGFTRITIAYVLLSLVLGFGFVLLFVPGLVALAYFWVAWPLVVLEEASGIDAMKRSVAIVDGYKLKITAVAMALIALYIVLGIAQVAIATVFGAGIDLLTGAVIGIATNALALAIITLSYHRFREAAGV